MTTPAFKDAYTDRIGEYLLYEGDITSENTGTMTVYWPSDDADAAEIPGRVKSGTAYCHAQNDAHHNIHWRICSTRAEAEAEIAEEIAEAEAEIA